MRRIVSFILALVIELAVAAPVLAVDNGQSRAVVVLHAQAHNTKVTNPLCSDLDPDLPCSEYTTTWPVGMPADVYLVVAKGDSALGISGVSVGIWYQDVGATLDGVGCDVFGYTLCADLEYTNGVDSNIASEFPASGGGNRIIWRRDTNCQRHVVAPNGVQAIACVFYVYAYGPDTFTIDMNRNCYTCPEFQVIDCVGPDLSDMPWPAHAGEVGFGQPGKNPCEPDVTPPTLVSVYGAPGSNHVSVHFSEAVAGGSMTPSNYEVFPTADSTAFIPVNSASVSGAYVTLTLASNLAAGTQYAVRVSNVEDEVGNVVAPGSTLTFTTTGGPDTTPPTLLSVYGAPGTSQVSVHFSETVAGGAATPSNYEVYPTADSTAFIPANSASVSGSYVTLTLAWNLASGTQYAVRVSNVEDAAGNVIAPNSTLTFTTTGGTDTTPPTLVSVYGPGGGKSISVVFSETVAGGATTPSNYEVFPTADSTAFIPVNSASVSGSQVTLTLASYLAGGTQYAVRVSNVEDAAGNAIAPNSILTFTTSGGSDTTPPTLVGASGFGGSASATVEFSEPVGDGAATASNYALYPTADPSSAIPVNSATPSNAEVALALGTALTGGTDYTIRVSGVQDLAGNPIVSNSTVAFVAAAADTIPPVMTHVYSSAYDNFVSIHFSETVTASAAETDNYRVFPVLDPSALLSVTSASVDEDNVVLRLGSNLAALTTYRLRVSNVQDLSGNTILPNSSFMFTPAGGEQANAVVALHVQSHVTKGFMCPTFSSTLTCDRFTQSWPIRTPADVFMVVALARADLGISALDCGISYDPAPGEGCDVFGYTRCCDVEYTNAGPYGAWPASHGGNILVWDRSVNCQRTERGDLGVHAVACAFYVYAYGPDLFSVIQDENRGSVTFEVVDCHYMHLSRLEYPSHAGAIGFGMDGYNPCAVLPVGTVRTTWGRLKNQYH